MASVLLMSPGVITKMIEDPRFHEFSFLKNPPLEHGATASCRSCGRSVARNKRYNWHAIKRSVIGLADTQKSRLKQLLGNPDQIKIIYRDTRNRMQTVYIN